MEYIFSIAGLAPSILYVSGLMYIIILLLITLYYFLQLIIKGSFREKDT